MQRIIMKCSVTDIPGMNQPVMLLNFDLLVRHLKSLHYNLIQNKQTNKPTTDTIAYIIQISPIILMFYTSLKAHTSGDA